MNFVLTAEVIGLILLSSLTILAYMIALNAQGITRISLSFLMATILLGTNVFTVVQYVNNPVAVRSEGRDDSAEQAALEREVLAEKLAEQKAAIEQEAREDRERKMEARQDEAQKILSFITDLEQTARDLQNMRLVEHGMEYGQLTGRASRYAGRVRRHTDAFSRLQQDLSFFVSLGPDVADALKALERSTEAFQRYYTAETSAQEAQRENVMRRSAQESLSKLSQVRTLLTTSE
ncbi:hypothetical protein [Chitinivibrio alkaliphilus]|uniref:Uncharacterized protein n=1 Tax=Chitinivibrio alkaliphilus ACht1 TaxID=1313304 RepID=U7DCT1_9BACT|nr:hypothetical protein [Chitinivibrio alkaliphilus]ERP38706.1 hypothetical protein CALK_0723 [Chitinivibrio alkaliphilus ACht1]